MLAENHATPEQMEKVASNISLWGEIDFEEKRFTVDKMIRSLRVFPGSVQIQWKFLYITVRQSVNFCLYALPD